MNHGSTLPRITKVCTTGGGGSVSNALVSLPR